MDDVVLYVPLAITIISVSPLPVVHPKNRGW